MLSGAEPARKIIPLRRGARGVFQKRVVAHRLDRREIAVRVISMGSCANGGGYYHYSYSGRARLRSHRAG